MKFKLIFTVIIYDMRGLEFNEFKNMQVIEFE